MEEREGVFAGAGGKVVGTEPMPSLVGSVFEVAGGKLKNGKEKHKPNFELGPNRNSGKVENGGLRNFKSPGWCSDFWVPMLLSKTYSILTDTWYPLVTIGTSGQMRFQSGVRQLHEIGPGLLKAGPGYHR